MAPSSVRARLDAERERNQPEEIVRPVSVSSTTRQAGSGLSVRQRAERAQSLATPEKLTPLDKHRATGLTANMSHNESVRSRLDRERHAAEAQTTAPTISSATEFYYAEYKREQAEKEAREAREAREHQERIAREQREAANQRANALLQLSFDSAAGGAATPTERRRIIEAAKRKYPSQELPTPEQAMTILMVLRGGI